MANVSLLFDKPSDLGTYSGGSWVAGLPLSNLKTDDVQAVARSIGTAPSATRFRIDAGTEPLPGWSQFVLLNHNATSTGTIQVVVTDDPNDAGPRLYDSGARPFWVPTIVWGSRPWGTFPGDGIDTSVYPRGTVYDLYLPEVVFGRYVWVYINDPTNPAGYVQVGRFIGGQAWSPRINCNYGASIGWTDPAQVRRTRTGRRIAQRVERYRVADLQFDFLDETEAWGVAAEITRLLGKAGDFFFVADPEDDPTVRYRRSFYAALVDPAPVIQPMFDAYSWRLQIEEIV